MLVRKIFILILSEGYNKVKFVIKKLDGFMFF